LILTQEAPAASRRVEVLSSPLLRPTANRSARQRPTNQADFLNPPTEGIGLPRAKAQRLTVGDIKRAAGRCGGLGGLLAVHEQLEPAVAPHGSQMLPARAQVAIVSHALAGLQDIDLAPKIRRGVEMRTGATAHAGEEPEGAVVYAFPQFWDESVRLRMRLGPASGASRTTFALGFWQRSWISLRTSSSDWSSRYSRPWATARKTRTH